MIYGNITSAAPARIIASARRYAIIAPLGFMIFYSTLWWSIIWPEYQETFAIIFFAALSFNALLNVLRFLYFSSQIMSALNDLDRVSPLRSDVKDIVLQRLHTMRRAIRFAPFISALIPFLAATWPLVRYRMSYALPCMVIVSSHPLHESAFY